MQDRKGSTGNLMSLSVQGAVATLCLQRPPMNQVNDEFLREIEAVLISIEQMPQVVVLRIVSNQRAFCAGADLEMVNTRVGTPEGARAMAETARLFHRVYDRLASLPAVTIAEINGHALGGGLELALACDLRVAASDVKLGLPEAKVGLLPGAGGTQRLTRLCGPGIAARLILGGEVVDGPEAARIGLVHWAVERVDLVQKVDSIIERVVSLSPDALRECKSCISQAMLINPVGVETEVNGIEKLMMTEEARKRVHRFVNKA